MANTSAASTAVPINTDTPAPKTTRANAREEGGKQVGAWFNPAEYEELREVRFVKRHDKDSDVIKAAVREYVDKYSTPSL